MEKTRRLRTWGGFLLLLLLLLIFLIWNILAGRVRLPASAAAAGGADPRRGLVGLGVSAADVFS